MGDINTSFTERVRYTLFHKESGSLTIKNDPEGWENDDMEYARHEQYHGIFVNFSNNLRFVGDAKDFIQLVYDIYGINAEVRLKKEILHPKTDLWVDDYSGYLDLSTIQIEGNKLACKFNSGGLEQLLKARESEQVEINRNHSIDGKPISHLETIDVKLSGRRIFLKSQWETKTDNNDIQTHNFSDDGNKRNYTVGCPMELINKSHEEASDSNNQNGSLDSPGLTSTIFFFNAEFKRTLRVKINLNFKVDKIDQFLINWAYFGLYLTIYAKETLLPIKRIELKRVDATEDPDGDNYFLNIQGQRYFVDFDEEIKIDQGQSISLEFLQEVDFKNRIGKTAYLDFYIGNITCKLTVEEDSNFEPTVTKAILAHDLGDRLTFIATNNEKVFYSQYFGRKDLGYSKDGPGAFTGLTHGFWVRGFNGPIIPGNLFKPLTTSFADFIDSMAAIWNVGLGIEKTGFTERIIIEDLKYFYNRNVTIRLPNQVKNVKRSIATEHYYSGLEFGSEKGGDYEEACGLDEYNSRATFTTVINRLKKTYSRISRYRFDSYGMEFARRQQKNLNDTEDTVYDSDVFVMDLKKTPIGTYVERKWQDDFSQEPTGVFSPETATNLRLSPFNCLLRHSWWFSSGFKCYATDRVRYASSAANSQLKTRLIGGIEYAENGDIINSELQKSRFINEWIEFEHIVDYEIMQQIQGYTIVSGEKIYNVYGLVEFINENSEKEKGYLFNLKPNGSGKWRILKANFNK